SFAVGDLLWRPANSFDHATINSRKPDRVDAAMPQMRQDLRIDLSAKDHFRQVESFVVRDAAAFDNGLCDAQFLRQFAELFPAAVNDAQAYADLMDQGEFFGKRGQIFGVFRDFARKFNDKSF